MAWKPKSSINENIFLLNSIINIGGSLVPFPPAVFLLSFFIPKIMNFQIYSANVKNPIPIQVVNDEYWLWFIKYSTPEIKLIFEALRHVKNQEEKRKLKEKLYYVTPAVLTDGKGRGYKNIIKFTGIMPLDFDKIEDAADFRDFLFESYEFIFAAWLSASGNGVRAFVSIPICESVDEYKSYFWGLANEIMYKYKGFDIAPQNCVLPLFLSYDPDLRFKDKRFIWNRKGVNPKEVKAIEVNFSPNNNFSSAKARWIAESISKKINAINDNGHPQVRAAAFVLGGYVAANLFDYNEALDLLHGLIASNNYLSKGTKGYQKTANEMLNKGLSKPIYF